MSRIEAWALHVSTILVGGTGLAYAWMLWFVAPSDEFAVVNHPWQPHALHLHVLFAPFLVFAVGVIWRRHVWFGWTGPSRERRRSGIATALTFAPMVVSGYLLQVASDEVWRRAWIWVHVATSVLWLLGYAVHQGWRLAGRWRGRRSA